MFGISRGTPVKKRADNEEPVAPSFFVVGAQKAGTTALHHYLARHPDIFLPAIKETHFFDDGHGEFQRGIHYYIDEYFHAGPNYKLAGEVDPEYLFFPEAASRIAKCFPKAKLIFIFRDPVARAYSHYQMSLSRGRERLDFAHALAREDVRMELTPESLNADAERVTYQPAADSDKERRRIFTHVAKSDFSYRTRGLYFRQVSRYLSFFPQEQMLFLLAEDLKVDATETLRRVYKYLGVREVPFMPLTHEHTNAATLPRSERLQEFLLDKSLLKTWLKRLVPSSVRLALRHQLVTSNARASKLPTIDADIVAFLRLVYREDVENLRN